MNNTNYKTTSIPVLPMEEKTPEVEPLSNMILRANRMLDEALQMTYRINAHMFGIGEPSNEKTCEPSCYRDAMFMHAMNLEKLCTELSEIMQKVGV